MAKADTSAISKKQALVEYLTAHSEASTTEAIEAMKKRGLEVAESTVYNAKWWMNKEKSDSLQPAPKKARLAAKNTEAAAPAADKVNKTLAVKEYQAAHPDAGRTEISMALREQGIDVTPAYVSGIRVKLKVKKRKKRAARQAAPGSPAAAAGQAADDSVSLDSLRKAKALVRELGGVDQARQALKALATLLD